LLPLSVSWGRPSVEDVRPDPTGERTGSGSKSKGGCMIPFCEAKNCLKTITVMSCVMTAVCLFLAFMLFHSMRYERKMHEEKIEQMMNSTFALVDSHTEFSTDAAKKYHKSNWKVDPSKIQEKVKK